jgi:putative transposase
VRYLVAEEKLSVRRACNVVGLARSAWYCKPVDWTNRDSEVIDALQAMVEKHRRWGFWMCFHRLRLDGRPWNHKRVYRIYTALGLNHRRKTKKRLPKRTLQPLEVAPAPNEVWSIDFMHDGLYGGRSFRTFNILDDGVREILDIEIDTSLPGPRIVRVLERVKAWRGAPKAIRCDNGPELLSGAFTSWCEENDIEIRYIQPGKPNQNAFIERFNRTYREEVLSAYLFEDLDQVREITWEWMQEYNEERPHDALGNVPPAVFREAWEAGNSTFKRSA